MGQQRMVPLSRISGGAVAAVLIGGSGAAAEVLLLDEPTTDRPIGQQAIHRIYCGIEEGALG